jgi:lipid-A-disaccharide synthase
MYYYLIAGEASGDLHASNLMKALKKRDPEGGFRFFGGNLMKSVGGTLVRHYRKMAFMGIIPVILNSRTILSNIKYCCRDIDRYDPDMVILIDYPGFNLKIAKYVKEELDIPVYYYIPPKIWAWKKYRIKSLRKYVEQTYCILPFEVDFYKSLDYRVNYVGNPSVDSVHAFREERANKPDNFLETHGLTQKPVMAILPGSRRQELKGNLTTMLSVAAQFPDYHIVIAGAPGMSPEEYNRYTGRFKDSKTDIRIVFGWTYDLLSHSAVALVTSGTATLETALFRVPQVVCYQFSGGKLVNFVFKRFFHVPYISLVNLIAGREVVQELFGAKFRHATIVKELKRIIEDKPYRDKMLAGYDEVITTLGEPGAAERTEDLIYNSFIKLYL